MKILFQLECAKSDRLISFVDTIKIHRLHMLCWSSTENDGMFVVPTILNDVWVSRNCPKLFTWSNSKRDVFRPHSICVCVYEISVARCLTAWRFLSTISMILEFLLHAASATIHLCISHKSRLHQSKRRTEWKSYTIKCWE